MHGDQTNSSDYSPSLNDPPFNGQFWQKISRSEGDSALPDDRIFNHQTSSASMPVDPSYLSPRVATQYGQSRAALRFHALRGQSSSMLLSPAAYSTYGSQYCGSPVTFGTPLTSPLQPEFHDSTDALAYQTTHMLSDDSHSGYASPLMLQHSPGDASEYYSHGPLVSPPITPMESQTFASQMAVTFDLDGRSGEYPITPYTPTYSYQMTLGEAVDSTRRPVSAGRVMPQDELCTSGVASNVMPLKRAASLNSSRFAKSLTPPRSGSTSPPTTKRPGYIKWTPEEDEMLRAAITIHGTSKWSLVASMVKGRTAMQCSTRWQGALNTSIHKGKWEPEEDRILIAAVEKWKAEHPPRSPSSYESEDDDEQAETIPWGLIASMLPRRRTGIQCQARWSEALDPTVRKGKWTNEEDGMLFAGVKEFGTCWIKVASRVRGRTQRQIRTRWMQIRGRDKTPKV